MAGYHKSVLLGEIVEALAIRDAWYLDTTIGDGGHSIEILKRGGKVVGIDVDPQALKRVQVRFEEAGIDKSKYKLLQGNFRDLKNLVSKTKFAGAIFDLGVSSLQLETPQRGFSFSKEGPLDMRMDPKLQVKALDLVDGLNKGELDELFSKLGEEKHSKRLADALVRARQVKPIETTTELAGIAEKTLGRKGRINPATKVFQALRIAVNDELNALSQALPQALEVVEKNGRILVISFHSLEDRIVKNLFKQWQYRGLGQVLTKKPIRPTVLEIRQNPRARSAKLRIFQK